MEIIGVKLRNGEEVVAQLVATNAGGELDLRRPLIPTEVQNPQGQRVMTFYKLFQTSSAENFTLFKDDYIGEHFPVVKQLEDAYLEATSSIQVVHTGLK